MRHVIKPIQTGQLFRRESRFRCDGPALNAPRRQLERLVQNGASDMTCGHGADQPGCQGANRCLFTRHRKEVMPRGQADDLRAGFELSKTGVLGHLSRVGRVLPCLKPVCSDKAIKGAGQRHQGSQFLSQTSATVPAIVAMRFNPDLEAKFETLRASGKAAKLAIAAIMRTFLETANAPIKADRFWQKRHA